MLKLIEWRMGEAQEQMAIMTKMVRRTDVAIHQKQLNTKSTKLVFKCSSIFLVDSNASAWACEDARGTMRVRESRKNRTPNIVSLVHLIQICWWFFFLDLIPLALFFAVCAPMHSILSPRLVLRKHVQHDFSILSYRILNN